MMTRMTIEMMNKAADISRAAKEIKEIKKMADNLTNGVIDICSVTDRGISLLPSAFMRFIPKEDMTIFDYLDDYFTHEAVGDYKGIKVYTLLTDKDYREITKESTLDK